MVLRVELHKFSDIRRVRKHTIRIQLNIRLDGVCGGGSEGIVPDNVELAAPSTRSSLHGVFLSIDRDQ